MNQIHKNYMSDNSLLLETSLVPHTKATKLNKFKYKLVSLFIFMLVSILGSIQLTLKWSTN